MTDSSTLRTVRQPVKERVTHRGFDRTLLPEYLAPTATAARRLATSGAQPESAPRPAPIGYAPVVATDLHARRRPGLITVYLADDHQVMRQGLRSLFDKETDFEVVGDSGQGMDVVKQVDRLQPTVLVLDLMMDGINGLELTRQVCELSPQTRIVILSTQGNEAYVSEALRAGAKAYVLKDSSFEELVTAIRKAALGQHFLSISLSERMIEAYSQKRDPHADPYETLTTREREVLLLASHGQSNAKIAERLVISRRTVEVHRAKMMHKLSLSNQIELVRYAMKRGII